MPSTPIWSHLEPTVEEMLSDPIIIALMQADGVRRYELEQMLERVRERLYGAPQPSDQPVRYSQPASERHTGTRAASACWC